MAFELLLRQWWVLVKKNLLIALLRRPISTLIRALLLPLTVTLILAFSKTAFSSTGIYGIGPALTIPTLAEVIPLSPTKNIIGIYDGGFKNGDVAHVVASLSKVISDAGGVPRLFSSIDNMTTGCEGNNLGYSPCFAGVQFLSSATEPQAKGTWNYTIYTDGADGHTNIMNKNGIFLKYLMPLQKEVDFQIASSFGNGSTLAGRDNAVQYTQTQESAVLSRSATNFMILCAEFLGAFFFLAMLGLVYHLTSFIAQERELGMSQLIDSMVLGGSSNRGRFLRLASTYASFALIYLPSWFVVGISIALKIFTHTSPAITIIYHLLNGLALCSFSLLFASVFKKAQLSGAAVSIVTLVMAILSQALQHQTQGTVTALSLIFPSSNYVYNIVSTARFEGIGRGLSLTANTPAYDTILWSLQPIILWVFLLLQIILYPVAAFYVEKALFGADSAGRKLVPQTDARAPTVKLSNFSKTYNPTRIFRRKTPDVHAVVDMSLNAYQGQILALLGPNGSGKSTTLNAIAGAHKISSGEIHIDSKGGLGFAPQANVIWPDATVEEHVKIFTALKARTPEEAKVDIGPLILACDLEKKTKAKSSTLSGGQKRKLQLAMMFAGGSAVCCVDEISTGLDPISRRKIWDILLAERGRRTIILTTHFLDEADFLADNIAIMSKGALKVEGSAAELKHRYGNGYSVRLPTSSDRGFTTPEQSFEKDSSTNETIYRVPTAGHVAELVRMMETQHIRDYQISGPTIEELFLKLTGTTKDVTDTGSVDTVELSKTEKSQGPKSTIVTVQNAWDLSEGRPISPFAQWWQLFRKRFVLLRRSYMPYIVAICLAVIGAGVAPTLINHYTQNMACPSPHQLQYDTESGRIDFAGDFEQFGIGVTKLLVLGPSSKITDDHLDRIARVYSVNNTNYPQYAGVHNLTELKETIIMVDTIEEFNTNINKSSGNLSPGGIFLSDPPVLAFPIDDDLNSGMFLQNFADMFQSDVDISMGFNYFQDEEVPPIDNFGVLAFVVYFGLILCGYPSFFALYPTAERLRGVRSMQYSNGVRPLPLWLSHLTFDSCVILIISIATTFLLLVSTRAWYGLGELFVVFVLYGIASALLSYIFSMISPSTVSAWIFAFLYQVVIFLACFGGLLGLGSGVVYSNFYSDENKLQFSLALLAPSVSLLRAICISLNQFTLLCRDSSNPGSILLFGGPILYLLMQAIVLFIILLLWDSGFSRELLIRLRHRNTSQTEPPRLPQDVMSAEISRAQSPLSNLRVLNVTKRFGRNLATSDITFGVKKSEIFALLGPNGAGKSTIISLIRGDIKPSSAESSIHVAGHSVLTQLNAARSQLGVCPQFDAADNLTVAETLRFYALIKGVEDPARNVASVIAACQLEDFTNQLAHKLSGGTKRKLSLAAALVGNPTVLVLDEPSSALDASAKRTMWKTLQGASPGRSILLTTHSMEEADALADRVGIMDSAMLAIGGREELKQKAGNKYYVHMVLASAPHTTNDEMRAVRNWIWENVAGATIETTVGTGQIKFDVPIESTDDANSGRDPWNIAALFELLEREKERLGVAFYSVGRATLDQVFVDIVGAYSRSKEARV